MESAALIHLSSFYCSRFLSDILYFEVFNIIPVHSPSHIDIIRVHYELKLHLCWIYNRTWFQFQLLLRFFDSFSRILCLHHLVIFSYQESIIRFFQFYFIAFNKRLRSYCKKKIMKRYPRLESSVYQTSTSDKQLLQLS